MLATVLLSQGTPMILGGDEFGRTQHGNNNAYCQDNETSWFDWELANSDGGKNLMAFVARLVSLRHQHPILRCVEYLHGKDEPAPGMPDIQWFDEQGRQLTDEDWNNPRERTLILQRASRESSGMVPILTCLFNPTAEDRLFKLPPPNLPARQLLDSADLMAGERDIEDGTLPVKARSVVLVKSVHVGEPPPLSSTVEP
jgi:glycogen operon protein